MMRYAIRVWCLVMMSAAMGMSGMSCPQGDGDDNGGGDDDGGGDGSGVKVTIHGALGVEQYMRAVVWVGSRAVTRAEAADPATLRGAGFADTEIENNDTPGDVSRTFNLEAGEVATIIAVEWEGNFGTTQWPVGSAPAPSDNLVEFLSFTGATTIGTEAGVATFTNSISGEVTVNFQRMPQILLYLWGVTNVQWEFTVPTVLGLPASTSNFNTPFSSSGPIAAPNKLGFRNMQFKSGTTVKMTCVTTGDFLRWEDSCGGSGLTCTLIFGGASGSQDQETTLVTGYRECNNGGPPTYSGYTTGNPPGAGCMIVLP